MDTQWVERQVEVIKQRGARLRHEEEVRLHDSRVIESQGPRFFEALIASTKAYARAINESFPAPPEQRLKLFDHGKNGMFSVSRGSASVDCTLDLLGRSILFRSPNGLIFENGIKLRVGSDGSLEVVSTLDLLQADTLAKQIVEFVVERSMSPY